MDKEQLSEIIAQVLTRMNINDSQISEKKKALIIFEDLEKGLARREDFKQIEEEYNISILTAKNISGVAAPGGFEKIFFIEDLPSDCNKWVKQFERVLIPSPSLKIVSKLAHVILDDKYTELVFAALQERKQVLIGQVIDGNTVNFKAALRMEIQKLANKLKDYGIEQLSDMKLPEKHHTMERASICKTKGVISLRDVMDILENNNELSIGADTVVTPLAMDYIRERKISINRKD